MSVFQGMLLCTLDAAHPAHRTALALIPAHSMSGATATALLNAVAAHTIGASRALLTLVLEYALTDYLVCFAGACLSLSSFHQYSFLPPLSVCVFVPLLVVCMCVCVCMCV
jgi:hypothetical protein